MNLRNLMFLASLLVFPAIACGDIYTQTVSLAHPFGQTPFAVSNAFLREESFGPNVRYWQPTLPNLLGTVTYKFDVPFGIDTAQLSLGITAYTFGSDSNFDPAAEAHLDVSIDNLNWTTVASQTPSNAQFSGISGPWDITSIVAGSQTVYVRSRLFMTTEYTSFAAAQFLREGAPYAGGYFTATSVPESSLLAATGFALLVAAIWQSRQKVSTSDS